MRELLLTPFTHGVLTVLFKYASVCVCVLSPRCTVTHVNGEGRTNIDLASPINQRTDQFHIDSLNNQLIHYRDEEIETQRWKGLGQRQPRIHHLPARQPIAQHTWLPQLKSTVKISSLQPHFYIVFSVKAYISWGQGSCAFSSMPTKPNKQWVPNHCRYHNALCPNCLNIQIHASIRSIVLKLILTKEP